MSTKKAHSSALKNNQALSLFYLFFHFKSSLERAGSRTSPSQHPWRGCRREHRAQLTREQYLRPSGRRKADAAASQQPEAVARGGPAPSGGSSSRQRQLIFPQKAPRLLGLAGLGSWRQVSGPGLMPKAPARPSVVPPLPGPHGSEHTLEGSLAPGEPSGVREGRN